MWLLLVLLTLTPLLRAQEPAAPAEAAAPAAAEPPPAESPVKQSTGSAILPGEYYRSTVYQGTDPLSGQGSLMWRVDEGRGLFTSRPGDAGRAWQFEYRGQLPRPGLNVGFSAAESDAEVTGASALGLNPGQLGLRRADYSAEWQEKSFSLRFDGGRTEDRTFGQGVGRESLSVRALGAWYSRERYALDDALSLESAAHDRVLGRDGYNLAGRSVGAGGGYTNLNALGGLRDTSESLGFEQGQFRAALERRNLERGAIGLTDSRANLSYAGLSYSRTQRQVDEHAQWLKEAGYGSLQGLRGSTETRDGLAFNNKAITASWNRLVTAPTDAHRGVATNETEERSLAYRPWEGAEISLLHRDTRGGSTSAMDRLGLRYTAGQNQLQLAATTTRQGAALAPGELSRRLEASYKLGRALTLAYTGDDWTRRTDAENRGPGQVDPWRATHAATIESALGLTLRGRLETGEGREDGRYTGLGFERQVVEGWAVRAAYDSWLNTTDAAFEIAGQKRVLATNIADARHFRVGTTWDYRGRSIGAERRTLWYHGTGSGDTRPAERSLTETSLRLTQPLWGNWQARGSLALTEDQDSLRGEQREAAVSFAPGGQRAFEVGWREARAGGSRLSPTAFASAGLTPWLGLRLGGEVQQQAGQGGHWGDPGRRTIKFSATQSYLGDGRAAFELAHTPGRLPAAGEAPEAGRSYTVDLATPSNFLFQGLRLSSRWKHQTAAGGPIESLLERSASVAWTADWLGTLSATYADRGTVSPFSRGNVGRLTFEYASPTGRFGRLVLSGYLDDVTNRLDLDRDREKYRVGFQYQLPF